MPINCPLFQIDLLAGLAENDSNLMWKRQTLFELGLSPRKVFRINACGIPFEVILLQYMCICVREGTVFLIKICVFACTYILFCTMYGAFYLVHKPFYV